MNLKPLYLPLYLLFSLIIAQPRLSHACSVCFVDQGDSLWAYYGTTILMILLPFSVLGLLGWWVYRKLLTETVSETK